MTFAENLSLRHNLLIFHYQSRDAAGNLQYPSLYNRFPLGGYALVKLAIFPFGDTDFQAQIYAGRMLLLLLFSAAAVLAYAALARITGSRWDAPAATLLAFSSYYMLYYADKISNEVTIDLSASAMAGVGQSGAPLAVEAEEMADYAAIRELAAGSAVIYIPWRPHNIQSGGAVGAAQYFLAGKTLIYHYAYVGPAADPDGPPGRDYLCCPRARIPMPC